jgi:MYXO-CTERM domain-containing protein
MRFVNRSWLGALAVGTAVVAIGSQASAQDCFSDNPADWPPPARPYFMVVFDTSGSMTSNVPTTDSCGYGVDRIDHAKCALRKMAQAYSEVDFGLITFNQNSTTCPTSGSCGDGVIRVGVNNIPTAVSTILQLTDDASCSTSNPELRATGVTPIAQTMVTAANHLRANTSLLTPNCREVALIVIADGGDNCPGDPPTEAHDLYVNGLQDGSGRHVRTYTVGFGGVTGTALTTLNNTAKEGQCGTTTGTCANSVSALLANNETELSQAFANIISSAIRPEDCNNVDDNCNGCVDEGYKHYCNRNRTPSSNPSNDSQCCNWTTTAQRDTCISNFQASITTGNPTGDRWELPCFTPTTSLDQHLTQTDRWLCYNPGDVCDELDNNCDGDTPNASTVDENALKCNGHCPATEICNGEDDDCNNIIDETSGSAIPYSIPNCVACTPSTEICNGIDDNCNGQIDENITPLTCGFSPPANCAGTISCVNGSWGTCSNNPSSEVCDGADNNCNGQIDEGITPTPCDIPGQPGLVYNDTNPLSVCQRGQQPCNGQCAGWVGPSQEICDGLDNDCDGLVDGADSDLIGGGQICDGVCDKGITACVNGTLVCQSSIQPQPEVCDGLDNDCNGIVDDGSLIDAPTAAETPCWDIDPTACTTPCSYVGATNTVTWCAPDDGGCHDIGTLAAPPCALGSIACSGGAWTCSGGLPPVAEVCDGVDNDCNASIDDGLSSTPCGTDEGECQAGTQLCDNGSLVCQGAVGPVPEVCNALDDDCDGVIDNGIAIGTPCTPDYDATEYPGARDKGQCKPGVSECGPSGQVICTGGVGPSPEVCDGLDNDCDGQVDEVGDPSNGLNGTANPNNPSQIIGETCGNDVGACDPGVWACVNAGFVCVGGVAPQTEVCDCEDNDCDGETDEDPEPGEAALCSEGKACVVYQNGCQCAGLCGGGEYPCPTGGFVCEAVTYSSNGDSAGNRCVIDSCGDCSTKTVTGSGGAIECAPAGTVLDGGATPPVCECKQNSCHKPCFGVSCAAPQVCTDFGPNAGKCVEDSCWNVPCGPEQACNLGSCVDNPCQSDSCASDEACKPSEDFSSFECVGSCAGVSCNPGEQCEGGQCVETGCGQDCQAGEVCNGTECVPSACDDDTCPNGSYCDPLTGDCGNEPCSGVRCPAGQDCEDGECVEGAGGTGGTGGAGGTGGTAGIGGSGVTDGGTTDGSAGTGGGTTGPETDEAEGNWGLATGGGGCACETGVGSHRSGLALALGLIGIAAFAQRRRKHGSRGTK